MSRPSDPAPLHPETAALHEGEGARPGAAPLTTPIYASTTFVFDSAADVEAYLAGESPKYLYTRYANPTVQTAEEKIARLEGAGAAILTSSGMAATATVLFGLLSAGDEVVCSSSVYGGTLRMATTALERFGIAVRMASLDEMAALDGTIGAKTKLVWFESPTNPTLRCVDIRTVADACSARGVLSVMDNTFASPVNQQPLSLGIDLVMHSATKYLNGHSDVTAGAVAGAAATIDRLRSARSLFGGVLDPAAAYALGRGMKTLTLRVARQNDSAQRVAAWLAQHPRVSRAYYPGLASHPDHAIATRQMRGFGGMVTFDLPDGYAGACRFYDRIALIRRAASLGGAESVCSLPVLTSHHGFSDAQLAEAGVTRGMVRLSIGLEHPDDLIADLAQALSA